MKKWDYTTSIYESNDTSRDKTYINHCKEKGQEGWELCTAQWHNGTAICTWKREIEAGKEIENTSKNQ